jgi:hypothetical protein
MGRQFKPGQLQTGSLYNISSSFAITASYALNSDGGAGFPFSGSAVITGSLLVSGSGITGSLFGTASFATTASYVNSLGSSNYSQSFSNSSTWTVTHNLGTRFVMIQTYDSGYDEMIPQNIDLTDNNTATITFPTQESGYAVASVGGALSIGSSTTTNTGSFAITGSNTFIGNQVITGSLTLSGSINRVNYVDFNTSYTATQPVAGRLSWNSADGTLDLGMKGGNVTQQIGQEIFYEVRNETGTPIDNGTLLYANGVTAGSGRITATPYTADGSVREVRLLGMATETISTGVNGFVTHFGYVRDLDTRGTTASSIAVGDETWAVGDILYAHPTVAGKLTNVRPKHEISVAIVIIRHQSTGVVFVRPTSYGHLDDIHDVSISTGSLASGDLLVYSSTLDYWQNSKQLTGSYGLTGSLSATSFTGSLFGTASYANQALSASWAPGSTTISTASFATTGSVTFTGNQIVSGSTRGNVTALSISSNTASMNLSVGNFFTLQLVSGSNTYINPSNILPGQTSILTLLTTGSATISWPNSVKQPSGSLYVPTTTTGIDILTLASMDASTLYVVSIKNMI